MISFGSIISPGPGTAIGGFIGGVIGGIGGAFAGSSFVEKIRDRSLIFFPCKVSDTLQHLSNV